ncbi:MAG: HAMP domain-containing protein [Spirochaetales bacterium]|nr:HAMP domain-containing protein [Spirochaetales bacterium]
MREKKPVIQPRNEGLGGVITLILVYLVVMALTLVFVNRILSESAQEEYYRYYFFIPFLILIPLILLVLVIFNLFQIIKQRQQKNPGARFRVKLTLYFVLTALISSLPQSVLSITIVGDVLNSWFSSYLQDVLQNGVDMAINSYQEDLRVLEAFAGSELAQSLLVDFTSSPRRLWQLLTEANPKLDALQIFSGTQGEIFFEGPPEARLPFLPREFAPAPGRHGLLPRENLNDLSLIRGAVSYWGPEDQYWAVLSSVLPPSFEITARGMTRALETFTQYRILQGSFLPAFSLFYLFFSLPLLLLSLLISFILSRDIIVPIVNLEAATRRVREGDLSFRLLVNSQDELATLSHSFNQMISELERSRKEILQTDKIAAWQEIAQRLAHEIKNPLTPIKLSAERILKRYLGLTGGESPGQFEEVLRSGVNSIIVEVNGLSRLLEEFRDFSRQPAPKLKPLDITALIEGAAAPYAGQYPEVTMDLSRLTRPQIIPADENQLKRVFSNLFKNAFESIQGPGKINLTYDLVRKGDTRYLRIAIADTGAGIAAEEHGKVFNPYFTTKTGGTGLGLSIVERIIFDHKGRIWFESEAGLGTTFFIDLPLGEVSAEGA